MRFVLTPMGSGGDVFPFLGLALKLRERGHHVAMITNGYFAPLVRSHGIEIDEFGTDEDYRKATSNPDVFHPMRGFKTVLGFLSDQRRLMSLIERHTACGAIVIHHTMAFAARLLQEAGRARVLSLALQPAVIRSIENGPIMGGNHGITRLPRFVQRGIWWGVDALLVDPLVAEILDPLRQDMGLPRQRHFFAQWLHSPELTIGMFPEFYAPPQSDWATAIRLASFPLCDWVAPRPAPAELLDLLDSGVRPVVFTPGTGNRYAHAFFAAAAETCARMELPAVLLSGHREHLPTELPPRVLAFDFAPLSQILHRCAALVHHGGIGTTAAALAAGVPQIVMPLSHDQPDNAARVVRLGCGDRLWPRTFTAIRLEQMLQRLLSSPDVAARCHDVQRFANCCGLDRAADLIEAQV